MGKDTTQMREAAAAAASAGYEHTAVLEGGLAEFDSADLAQVHTLLWLAERLPFTQVMAFTQVVLCASKVSGMRFVSPDCLQSRWRGPL